MRYPLLLSPFEIRGRELRNRIVSTPHATGWSRDGLIDRSEVDYHVRKAAGGCGLVMTFGSASVDPSTEASYGSIALWDERNEPALRALADGVHEHGALVISQATHMGRRGTSVISGIPLRAASDLPEGVHMEVPVPLATRRAAGHRRALRRRRPPARALRARWHRGHVVRRAPARAVLRPAGQHPDRRLRRLAGKPDAARARGAAGRAGRGVRPVHRRVPDDAGPMPDRRSGPGRDDRDRAGAGVDRGSRPLQCQRLGPARLGCRRATSSRATCCPRASSTSGRSGSGARSACRRWSRGGTSSRRWPRRSWPAGSISWR